MSHSTGPRLSSNRPTRPAICCTSPCSCTLEGAGTWAARRPRRVRHALARWTDAAGTTERGYRGDRVAAAPTPAEITYLLETVRHYFPACAPLEPVEAFAGLRVLPHAEGEAFGRLCDTRLHATHGRRVVSVYGGTLTAHRATTEKVVEMLRDCLPPRAQRADTRELPLTLEVGVKEMKPNKDMRQLRNRGALCSPRRNIFRCVLKCADARRRTSSAGRNTATRRLPAAVPRRK